MALCREISSLSFPFPTLPSGSPQLLCPPPHLFSVAVAALTLGSAPPLIWQPASPTDPLAWLFHSEELSSAGKGWGLIGGAESLKLAEAEHAHVQTWERGRRIRLSILQVWRGLASAGMTSRDALAARVAGTGPRWLGALVPLRSTSQSPIHYLAAKWRCVVRIGSKP